MWIGKEGCGPFGYTVDPRTSKEVPAVPHLLKNVGTVKQDFRPGAVIGRVLSITVEEDGHGVGVMTEKFDWSWHNTLTSDYYLSDQNGHVLPWRKFP